jgi:hypothetical protein
MICLLREVGLNCTVDELQVSKRVDIIQFEGDNGLA